MLPGHATVGFRNFMVFFGPKLWHIEIRHRVKKTFTINLFGFETLKLKTRKLKIWKPTVHHRPAVCRSDPGPRDMSCFLDFTNLLINFQLFLDMPCTKKVYRDK